MFFCLWSNVLHIICEHLKEFQLCCKNFEITQSLFLRRFCYIIAVWPNYLSLSHNFFLPCFRLLIDCRFRAIYHCHPFSKNGQSLQRDWMFSNSLALVSLYRACQFLLSSSIGGWLSFPADVTLLPIQRCWQDRNALSWEAAHINMLFVVGAKRSMRIGSSWRFQHFPCIQASLHQKLTTLTHCGYKAEQKLPKTTSSQPVTLDLFVNPRGASCMSTCCSPFKLLVSFVTF